MHTVPMPDSQGEFAEFKVQHEALPQVRRARGEPVVIWAKYRHAVRSICAELSGIYGADAVAPFYGEDSERERNAQLLRWRSGARFLIATQSAGGHGLTQTEAAALIWCSLRAWQQWEAGDRRMHAAFWELFTAKSHDD